MSDEKNTQLVASVILDKGIDKLLEYSVPQNLLQKVSVGSRVTVPIRNAPYRATIFELKKTASFSGKLLPIQSTLSESSSLPKDLYKLATWISDYYLCPLRKCIKLIIPTPVREDMKEKQLQEVFLKTPPSKLLTIIGELRVKSPKQASVLEFFVKSKTYLLKDLLLLTKTSNSPIETLIKNNILGKREVKIDRSSIDHRFVENVEFIKTTPKTLNDEQRSALSDIQSSLENPKLSVHLLFGITGSGKTEVYLQAIQKARSLGKDVILLIPEISLTTQTIERLKARFDEPIAIFHHRLSKGERHDMWKKCQQGHYHIAIGARSCVFAPLKNLGFIILDEEHDASYKQSDESPCYHARDVAIMRASFLGATVVLGSATPSFESYTHAISKKYKLNKLTKRPTKQNRPKITLIDLKIEREKAKGDGFARVIFTDYLIKAIKSRIDKGEQTMIFLNRRGYHPVLLCKKCQTTKMCPSCDVSLAFHKEKNALLCHYCGYMSKANETCSSCKGQTIQYVGYGTEYVESLIGKIFPSARVLRMDRDTTTKKGSHDSIFKGFKSGKADILLGTQMIAKGLDFPNVTLVGIIDPDRLFYIPDFRSSEKLFQLLSQVAGRAGRGDIEGEVILQTAFPNHPVIQSAADDDFLYIYNEEIALRQSYSYPPFTRLFKIITKSKNQQLAEYGAVKIHSELVKTLSKDHHILPVVASSTHRVKEEYRYEMLCKGPSFYPYSAELKKILYKTAENRSLKVLPDIDPITD